jgi:hypothetical protein
MGLPCSSVVWTSTIRSGCLRTAPLCGPPSWTTRSLRTPAAAAAADTGRSSITVPTADEAALGIDDVLKELVVGVAAVDDIEPLRLERGPELSGLGTVALGHGDLDRHALEHVEMDVHFGGAVFFIEPQGPGHLGQGGQEAAIDGGQAAQGLGLLAGHDRAGLAGQFGNEWVECFGVKDVAGFAERAQGDALAAEQLLHLVELAGLLDAAQAGDDGVEEVEQQQGGVLVEEEIAIAGAVALCRLVVEAVEQRAENLEILQAAQIGGVHCGPTLVCHGASVPSRRAARRPRRARQKRQVDSSGRCVSRCESPSATESYAARA